MSTPPAPPDDGPAFAPVPRRSARHDGWTEDRQRRFIAALARIGVVSAAAKAVGMSAKSAYNLRRSPGAESFAEAWDLALEIGRDHAGAIALERAIDGVTVPIFYRGLQVGQRRVYDDRLLLAALRSFMPLGSSQPPPDAS